MEEKIRCFLILYNNIVNNICIYTSVTTQKLKVLAQLTVIKCKFNSLYFHYSLKGIGTLVFESKLAVGSSIQPSNQKKKKKTLIKELLIRKNNCL